jgi:hypothetical protein
LYLRKQCGRNGKERFTIKRHNGTQVFEVAKVEVVKAVSKDTLDLNWDATPSKYNVYLTVDVLMALFVYPEKGTRSDVPLRICAEAERGNKGMVFHERFCSGRIQR